MSVYLIIAFVFVSSFLVTFVLLLQYSKSRDPLKQRIENLQSPGEMVRNKDKASVKKNLTFFDGNSEQVSETRLWLAKAGYRSPGSVSNYYGARLILASFLCITATIVSFNYSFDLTKMISSIILGALVGWFIPTAWVTKQILNRREQIRRSVPNMLDIMVVCVEAGLSFTAAIHRIVDENKNSSNPLYEELRLMTQEFLLGTSKAEAFRNLANRCGVDDLRSLAITLIQAEKLGTSIADSLRVLADSMRFKRRQRAEEQANKTSVKLVFPLVLLIFPELMVILIGPALINLYNTLSTVGT
jgi:tight adherence protein C